MNSEDLPPDAFVVHSATKKHLMILLGPYQLVSKHRMPKSGFMGRIKYVNSWVLKDTRDD